MSNIRGYADKNVDFHLVEDYTHRFSIILGMIYMLIPIIWIKINNIIASILNLLDPYTFVVVDGKQQIINGWFFVIGLVIILLWCASWCGTFIYTFWQTKGFIKQFVKQAKLCLVKVPYRRFKALSKIDGIYAGRVDFIHHNETYWTVSLDGVDECFGYIAYNHDTEEGTLMKPNFIGFLSLYGSYKLLDWFEVVEDFFESAGIFVFTKKEMKKERKESLKRNTDRSLKVLNSMSASLKKKSESELEEAQARMKQIRRNMTGEN